MGIHYPHDTGPKLPNQGPNQMWGVHLIPDVTAPKPYILLAQLLPPVEINRKVKHWTQQVSRPSGILEGGGAGGNFTTASF